VSCVGWVTSESSIFPTLSGCCLVNQISSHSVRGSPGTEPWGFLELSYSGCHCNCLKSEGDQGMFCEVPKCQVSFPWCVVGRKSSFFRDPVLWSFHHSCGTHHTTFNCRHSSMRIISSARLQVLGGQQPHQQNLLDLCLGLYTKPYQFCCLRKGSTS
jgi:hypothetical protein